MTFGTRSNIRKGTKAMKELARVYLSSNGKEFFIYDGNDNLISVVCTSESPDFADFGERVYEAGWHTLNATESE